MASNREIKRFRVFAGPNGSGKSTIINKIKNTVVDDYAVDCGIYVNADEIAVVMANGVLSFSTYKLEYDDVNVLREYAITSGLLKGNFTLDVFDNVFSFENNSIKLLDVAAKEYMAQILSNFLVDQLLDNGLKCSMETVFSHESKVELLRLAKSKGYKVYLYFVSTEDPEINKERVKARVRKGGHDVPSETIEKRYYRSLNLLYSAAQIVYRCYFFDNSGTEEEQRTVTHFKRAELNKKWDGTDLDTLPEWFVQYYINKRNESH